MINSLYSFKPAAWYRRTPDSFSENVNLGEEAQPEDVARAVAETAKRVTRSQQSAAVWFDSKLLAVVTYEQGSLFVRIVPTMRDYIALPWRMYG